MHPDEYAAVQAAEFLTPDTMLPREKVAASLTAAGYPIKTSTLAAKATRGNGPPYRKFSGKALYRWGDALAWAKSMTMLPRRNTSEADVQVAAYRNCRT